MASPYTCPVMASAGSSPEPPSPVAVDLRHYVDFDLAGASGRRVFATDVVAVDLVCLEPGQQVGARTLPVADAIYVVLGGRAWVVTDDAEVTLEPLQAVMVPAGVAHGLRNDGADPLILQLVVSPPDELPGAVSGPAPAPERAEAQPARPGLTERLRRRLGG